MKIRWHLIVYRLSPQNREIIIIIIIGNPEKYYYICILWSVYDSSTRANWKMGTFFFSNSCHDDVTHHKRHNSELNPPILFFFLSGILSASHFLSISYMHWLLHNIVGLFCVPKKSHSVLLKEMKAQFTIWTIITLHILIMSF